MESVADLFNQCFDLYENAERGMLTSPRKPSVHHEDDGAIDIHLEESVSEMAESVSAIFSSPFVARKFELDKKRAEYEARLALEKAEVEAEQNHALEIAKAEEQPKIVAAKLNVEERLIALSEKGSSVVVLNKQAPLILLLTYWEGTQTFVSCFAPTQNRTSRKYN